MTTGAVVAADIARNDAVTFIDFVAVLDAQVAAERDIDPVLG